MFVLVILKNTSHSLENLNQIFGLKIVAYKQYISLYAIPSKHWVFYKSKKIPKTFINALFCLTSELEKSAI